MNRELFFQLGWIIQNGIIGLELSDFICGW